MRVMVFFDLPTETPADRQEYGRFRRFLVKSGFLMLQESVYCKLALNGTVANSIQKSVRNHKPPRGLIQMLVVTEKQFSKMEFVLGDYRTDVIDSDERLIIL